MSKLREQFCKENNIELSELLTNKPIFKFYSYWLENKIEKQLLITDVVVPKGTLVCDCGRKLDLFDKHIGICIECKQQIK